MDESYYDEKNAIEFINAMFIMINWIYHINKNYTNEFSCER